MLEVACSHWQCPGGACIEDRTALIARESSIVWQRKRRPHRTGSRRPPARPQSCIPRRPPPLPMGQLTLHATPVPVPITPKAAASKGSCMHWDCPSDDCHRQTHFTPWVWHHGSEGAAGRGSQSAARIQQQEWQRSWQTSQDRTLHASRMHALGAGCFSSTLPSSSAQPEDRRERSPSLKSPGHAGQSEMHPLEQAVYQAWVTPVRTGSLPVG